jgi:fermentation-respiration switch protein FrsA (DUF1100 family)
VPEAERVRRERVREVAAGIVAYSADADCRTVVFALDGQAWVLRLGDDLREPAGVPEPVAAAGAVADPRVDPTGQRVAYVSGGALHVTELADGTGRVLAAPEHEDVSYGLPEHVAAESMYRYRGYERSSTITEAASLTRPLLLVHGLADDNVVVAHTLRMSAALLAAGREHQVLPLSGATHMPMDMGSQLLRHELAFLAGALGAARPDAD